MLNYRSGGTYFVRLQVLTEASMKMAVSWVVALMMEAASTCETSINFYQTTQRNNPEDSHLNSRRRENLRSHQFSICFVVYHLLLKVSTPPH
jgi:hypothetical protein